MLFNRFKEYLNKQFKFIPESKEANDFREELLGNLMARAVELQKDSKLTENEIFKKCIASLGDYSGTLKKLPGNPINTLRDKRFLRDVLFLLTFALICVVVYIAVAYITKKWGVAAIIIFPSMAGIIYFYFMAKVFIRNAMLNRPLLTGFVLATFSIIITTAAFFVAAFATPLGASKAWVLFAFIPFLISVSSALNFAFFRRTRMPSILIVLIISFFCIGAFLFVGVATQMWHPTWLIVFGVPISFLVAGIININKRINDKERGSKESE